MRKTLNEVVCLFSELGFHCALGSVCIYISTLFRPYILSTLLFLYGALRAHIRCKRLINTLLHYITYPVARRTACKRRLLIFPQYAQKATYKKPSSNTLAVASWTTTSSRVTQTPRKTAWNGATTWRSVAPWSSTPGATTASFKTRLSWTSLRVPGLLGLVLTDTTRRCAREDQGRSLAHLASPWTRRRPAALAVADICDDVPTV